MNWIVEAGSLKEKLVCCSWLQSLLLSAKLKQAVLLPSFLFAPNSGGTFDVSSLIRWQSAKR